MNNQSVYIETLGCAKNRVDSEIMMACMETGGFSPVSDPARAGVIVLNTCGFLTSAVNEGLDRFLELAEFKQEGKGHCECLVLAGCMSQRYKDELLDELPEADAVLGTSDFTQILTVVEQYLTDQERRGWFNRRPGYEEANLEAPRILSTLPHYAWVKIAEGCSNMCSFCSIPALRGGFHSKAIQRVVQECKGLIGQGVKELNLISQDTSSFGIDRDQDLMGLVGELSKLEGDFWVRLFYCYPNRFPLELLDLMAADPRFVPYLDLPFQHVNDRVLKAMNRKITREKLEKLLEQARTKLPGVSIRTSLIVGFPGETDRQFEELLKFVQEGWFDHLGVFAYSDEDNIFSNRLDDKVPEEVCEERREAVMLAQQEVSFAKNQKQVGQIQKVLVEGTSRETDLLLEGRNARQGVEVDGVVLINDGQATAGTFVEVEITEAHPYDLVGRIVS
ncbi:MAG: 30S ribosomal protein S12 methylthiotransferase RimO [bacterium]|nr:30S ribosomal protein S12 methylthiotransferase RimO [bacterium]